ncbi:protein DpdG [Bradyrhizobium elkanii]|uniref:protein DpdG n=1 Tax=Bradyrhizobium elkanii TaxID=29448 RepID=UPI002714ADB8|nr:protein DpdG [Bradyrhizobium elkanii]WLB09479.1 protein DpdG [Bradyrhizobium elkanii]WLB72575.1 protein DpdG [Bradyrhizobium elkanii]
MTILNMPSDGSFNVLMILFRALKEVGPMGDEELRNYCGGTLADKPERLRHTLNRWTALGLFRIKGDGAVDLGEGLEFGKQKEATTAELASLVRKVIFYESNNDNFWDSEKCACADLTRGLAWLLAQDIYTAEVGKTVAIQALESEQLTDLDRRLVRNSNRLEALRVWGLSLGFLWNEDAPLIDPTEAIGAELERLFGGSSELSAIQLQNRIAAIFPVIDGGRYRVAVEKELNPATWAGPPGEEYLSTSLSRALWRLNDEGRIALEHRADAGDVRVLQGAKSRQWMKFSHARIAGRAT